LEVVFVRKTKFAAIIIAVSLFLCSAVAAASQPTRVPVNGQALGAAVKMQQEQQFIIRPPLEWTEEERLQHIGIAPREPLPGPFWTRQLPAATIGGLGLGVAVPIAELAGLLAQGVREVGQAVTGDEQFLSWVPRYGERAQAMRKALFDWGGIRERDRALRFIADALGYAVLYAGVKYAAIHYLAVLAKATYAAPATARVLQAGAQFLQAPAAGAVEPVGKVVLYVAREAAIAVPVYFILEIPRHPEERYDLLPYMGLALVGGALAYGCEVFLRRLSLRQRATQEAARGGTRQSVSRPQNVNRGRINNMSKSQQIVLWIGGILFSLRLIFPIKERVIYRDGTRFIDTRSYSSVAMSVNITETVFHVIVIVVLTGLFFLLIDRLIDELKAQK
jgi:hypothetical protein